MLGPSKEWKGERGDGKKNRTKTNAQDRGERNIITTFKKKDVRGEKEKTYRSATAR